MTEPSAWTWSFCLPLYPPLWEDALWQYLFLSQNERYYTRRQIFLRGFVSSARLLHSVRSRGWVWMLPEILLPPGKTSRDQTEPWKYLIQTLGYRNFPLYFFIIKSRCSRHIVHWRCLELDTGQDLHADTITCKLGDIHKTSRLYCDLPTLWLCQDVLS